MGLYLDQNLALLTQKGFKKPTNCELRAFLADVTGTYVFRINCDTSKFGLHICAQWANRDWQRDAIPDILEKTKNISLNLIWSCSIKCFLFYEFYFDNCQTDM